MLDFCAHHGIGATIETRSGERRSSGDGANGRGSTAGRWKARSSARLVVIKIYFAASAAR